MGRGKGGSHVVATRCSQALALLDTLNKPLPLLKTGGARKREEGVGGEEERGERGGEQRERDEEGER